jgi:glycosyltransferase involved in cell wall biosynthesis
MSRPALSLVIPAFNSRAYLAANVARAAEYLHDAGIEAEIIVADDGSTDGTPDTITDSDRVRVLRLKHAGKGAALRAGMTAATGDIRAFTDADLPYGLEPIPLAISYIRERHFHAVIGDRTLPGSTYEDAGPLRRVVSELASFAFRTLVTGGIYDTQCGFKVFRGDVAAEIFRLAQTDGFAIDVEVIYLLLKYRLDLKRTPVRLERNAPSSVRVLRDSTHAFIDIARMRLRWASGRYRSARLVRVLQEDVEADLEMAATIADRLSSPGDPTGSTPRRRRSGAACRRCRERSDHPASP